MTYRINIFFALVLFLLFSNILKAMPKENHALKTWTKTTLVKIFQLNDKTLLKHYSAMEQYFYGENNLSVPLMHVVEKINNYLEDGYVTNLKIDGIKDIVNIHNEPEPSYLLVAVGTLHLKKQDDSKTLSVSVKTKIREDNHQFFIESLNMTILSKKPKPICFKPKAAPPLVVSQQEVIQFAKTILSYLFSFDENSLQHKQMRMRPHFRYSKSWIKAKKRFDSSSIKEIVERNRYQALLELSQKLTIWKICQFDGHTLWYLKPKGYLLFESRINEEKWPISFDLIITAKSKKLYIWKLDFTLPQSP